MYAALYQIIQDLYEFEDQTEKLKQHHINRQKKQAEKLKEQLKTLYKELHQDPEVQEKHIPDLKAIVEKLAKYISPILSLEESAYKNTGYDLFTYENSESKTLARMKHKINEIITT